MADIQSVKVRNDRMAKGSNSYAKNLNLEVIGRILRVLAEQGPINITSLAMHSGLNHVLCKKYLQSMAILDWIKFMNSSNTLIMLTDAGRTIQDSLNF